GARQCSPGAGGATPAGAWPAIMQTAGTRSRRLGHVGRGVAGDHADGGLTAPPLSPVLSAAAFRLRVLAALSARAERYERVSSYRARSSSLPGTLARFSTE